MVALWRIPALFVLCDGVVLVRDLESVTLPIILEILPSLLITALPVVVLVGMSFRRWRACDQGVAD